MSKYSSHAVTVSSGCDIVKYLKDFTTTQNFQAAFVVQCAGEVSRATLRMAESWNAYQPVKEVSDLTKIESFVGTISGGNGHLHASLSHKDGEVIGGHVFGPVVASGNVEIVVGECKNLSFTRTHDEQTGFPELLVLDHNAESNLQSESQDPTSQGEVDTTVDDLTIKTYALRLVPGEEICNGLNIFVSKHKLKEPFIMTCVGSITKAVICLGQDEKVLTMEGYFEIVSLLGTPKNLQISLSDKDGRVTTGRVTGELIVFTTAELVLGEKISE
ncbi:Hypothetical predicted protein [Paramuricea clavata]|uniref:Uncharacterized protein n=1 Tax=Paramuricea clavata TaxID=317549 RepID=A0A7D9EIM1_PARCT|nr:Hypothetical predicted protein [Paramuricea clavata]